MLIEVAALFFTLVLLTFLGYVFHWVFHQRWSGKFFRAHMHHHLRLYPPTDFYSDKYREAGKNNTFWLFAAVFAPLILAVVILTATHIFSLFLGISMLVEMAIIGFLNDSLHDAFHLHKTFWQRFWFFERLKKLHYNHHIKMNSNLGIFSFSWDKIFGTFYDIK